MNYNCHLSLWESTRGVYTKGLTVVDGHIWYEGEGYIARFDDDEHAIKTLEKAGYTKNKVNGRYYSK